MTAGAPGKIIWTEIDEAPALATYSLLPIVQKFTGGAGIAIETGRHLPGGTNPRELPGEPDAGPAACRDWLTQLGELAKQPEANIIKLPNISASVPQLKAAIKELQGQGYQVPDYPENPDERRRAGDQDALRQGAGQRGEPGAARGQLRPPRRDRGEGIRQEAPAQAGPLDAGLARRTSPP